MRPPAAFPDSDGIQIREAESADVDAIVAFGAAVVPAHYAPILGTAAARAQLAWWTRERIAPAVAAGRIHVALADSKVVGVVETGELAGEHVIWKLYLAPEFRGRRLGVELLRHAIAALPPEARHVMVEHFAGNTGAGAFYEREGFVLVKVEPASSGDPHAAIVWRRRRIRG